MKAPRYYDKKQPRAAWFEFLFLSAFYECFVLMEFGYQDWQLGFLAAFTLHFLIRYQ